MVSYTSECWMYQLDSTQMERTVQNNVYFWIQFDPSDVLYRNQKVV